MSLDREVGFRKWKLKWDEFFLIPFIIGPWWW